MVDKSRWILLACVVSASCGGESRDREGTGGIGGEISGATGGTRSGTGGADFATGGADFATGGVAESSGGAAESSGGAAANGGSAAASGGVAPFDPSNPGCQPSQWRCPGKIECPHDERGGVVVPAACYCDPSLPIDVVCGPNEKRACLHGTKDSARQSIRDVHFACHCVPAENTCLDCGDLFEVREMGCMSSSEENGTIICGCSWVDF